MTDISYIFQDQAIKWLAEANPEKVIEILRDDAPLTREFRDALADFMEGRHESNVRLVVKQPRGGTSKTHKNFERDFKAHLRICEYREQTGKAAYDACTDLAKELGMSQSALRKLHDAFNAAEAEIDRINRDEIDS